jgi:selenocysteine-specific elongation factor
MSGMTGLASRHVIGTAGHVDHGKTRLIEALTGVDPDRLPEEKRRGMTIDLGFAHFTGSSGEPVGVVDVPGHERFIRNMVAGAWGLDLALLLVAADDGWMQQSEDHTRVLAALGVRRLILVISKSDLADPAAVDNVRRRALDRLKLHGYGGAPSLPVSALTRRNIEPLRELILTELAGLEAEDEAAPYLYVDRVFKIAGAGTVVTGTLRGAPLGAEQELRLYPAGRKLRVRSLEAYYEQHKQVRPVSRVAVNLTGGESIRRGDLLTTERGDFQAVGELIARLEIPAQPEADSLLSAASGPRLPELKNQMEVELALGTAHTRARLHLLPGSGMLARFLLHEPLAARYGQPFLLIRQGGSAILGQGRILYLGSSTHAERQRLVPALRALPPGGGPAARLALALELDGLACWSRFLPEAPEPGPHRSLAGAWLFDTEKLRALEAEITALAGRSGGITFAELAGKIRLEEEPLRLLTRRLCDGGVLRVSRNVLLRQDAPPAAGLSPLGAKLLADLRLAGSTGLEVKKLGIAGGQKELRNLARMELAISLDGNIYLSRETYGELLRAVLGGLEPQERFSILQAKQRSGLSRKYVLPLLNRMELDGYVRREGDLRELVKAPPA